MLLRGSSTPYVTSLAEVDRWAVAGALEACDLSHDVGQGASKRSVICANDSSIACNDPRGKGWQTVSRHCTVGLLNTACQPAAGEGAFTTGQQVETNNAHDGGHPRTGGTGRGSSGTVERTGGGSL